jgi:hypothetical protein
MRPASGLDPKSDIGWGLYWRSNTGAVLFAIKIFTNIKAIAV